MTLNPETIKAMRDSVAELQPSANLLWDLYIATEREWERLRDTHPVFIKMETRKHNWLRAHREVESIKSILKQHDKEAL